MHARALLIEKMKFLIAKLRHERFGQSAERGAIIEQLELQLADLEENATKAETAAEIAAPANDSVRVRGFDCEKPARRPLPEHQPRERIVHRAPSACPCCGGALRKLGEDVTETLEVTTSSSPGRRNSMIVASSARPSRLSVGTPRSLASHQASQMAPQASA